MSIYEIQMSKAILRNSEIVIFDKNIFLRPLGWVLFLQPARSGFIDHLNHKTINNTTYRMPIMSTLIEKLSNCCDYFLRF